MEPDRWLFPSGAWAEVEAEIGTPLPAHYRDPIGDGLASVFGNELIIWSPFDPDPNANLGLRPDRRERQPAEALRGLPVVLSVGRWAVAS